MSFRRATTWIFLSLAAPLCGGCIAHSGYRLRLEQPHKDVAVVMVDVTSRLDAKEYTRIAEEELRHVLASRKDQDVPLYEVRFEFYTQSNPPGRVEKAATYLWRSEAIVSNAFPRDGESSLVLY